MGIQLYSRSNPAMHARGVRMVEADSKRGKRRVPGLEERRPEVDRGIEREVSSPALRRPEERVSCSSRGQATSDSVPRRTRLSVYGSKEQDKRHGLGVC